MERVVSVPAGTKKILVAIPDRMRSEVLKPRAEWLPMMVVEVDGRLIECIDAEVLGPSHMRYGPEIRRGVWLETEAEVRCVVVD